MSASMLQSLQGIMGSAGQGATPNVAAMAPDAASFAAQYGTPSSPGVAAARAAATAAAPSASSGTAAAPSSLAGGSDPYSQLLAAMQQQYSPTNIAMQGLSAVGQDFINKNVMQRQLAPPAPPAHTMTGQMGPLPFGSSSSPLLAYLSMLGTAR